MIHRDVFVRSSRWSACVAVLTLLACAGQATGQATGQDVGGSSQSAQTAPPAAQSRELSASASVNFKGSYTFESDLDEGAGSVSVSRAGAAVDLDFPVAGRSAIIAGVGAEASFYEFSDAEPPFGEADGPVETTRELDLSLGFRTQVSDRVSLRAVALLRSSGESGADFGETLTYGGAVGVAYAASERLILGVGIGARTQLEEDALVIPLPLIVWRATDKFTLRTGGGARGPGIEASYALTDTLTLSADVGYESRDFRLDDEGVAPDGVFRDRRVPVALGVTWKAGEQVELGLRAGAFVWQNYELNDANGDDITDSDADIAPFIEARAGFSF
jgi:hypothetical protein